MRAFDDANRVTTTHERMDELRPGAGEVDRTESDRMAAAFEALL